MEKECTRCHEVKPLSEYCKSSRHKMGVQPACKSCMNKAYTKSRQKKQQHYQQTAKQRSHDVVDKIWKYKEDHCCVVCGEDSASCIDFHHTDPATKDFEISSMRYHSWENVLTEIEKCVTVCRNCHAKIHANELCLISSLGVA